VKPLVTSLAIVRLMEKFSTVLKKIKSLLKNEANTIIMSVSMMHWVAGCLIPAPRIYKYRESTHFDAMIYYRKVFFGRGTKLIAFHFLLNLLLFPRGAFIYPNLHNS